MTGALVVVADRWSPSSKICSRCSAVRAELALSHRTFRCDACGHEADRNLNATRNLEHLAKIRDLASAEFTTLRLRLLKVAARIVEARHRVRIAFAAACPEADVIAGLSAALIRRRI